MRKGQSLVEYALILALVSIVSISVLSSLGQQLNNIFFTTSSAMKLQSNSNSVNNQNNNHHDNGNHKGWYK